MVEMSRERIHRHEPDFDETPIDRTADRLAALERELRDLRAQGNGLNRAKRHLTALERAQALYDLRRARDTFFGRNADLFSEPAWDILLDLFIAHERGIRVSVGSACIGACVSQSTGLRWIATLEHRGLVKRESDALDGRRTFVSLTPEARVALVSYLETC
jgi:DNA-binding MarR family transcriptional regulator